MSKKFYGLKNDFMFHAVTQLYSDKLCIRVLDLTQTALAGDSPMEQKLLKWANLFNAGSMEELEKLSKGEEDFEEMLFTMKKLSEDEKVRMMCEARERYERDLSSQYVGGFEDGEEAGIQKGIEQGVQQGISQGENKLSGLYLVRQARKTAKIAGKKTQITKTTQETM